MDNSLQKKRKKKKTHQLQLLRNNILINWTKPLEALPDWSRVHSCPLVTGNPLYFWYYCCSWTVSNPWGEMGFPPLANLWRKADILCQWKTWDETAASPELADCELSLLSRAPRASASNLDSAGCKNRESPCHTSTPHALRVVLYGFYMQRCSQKSGDTPRNPVLWLKINNNQQLENMVFSSFFLWFTLSNDVSNKRNIQFGQNKKYLSFPFQNDNLSFCHALLLSLLFS